MNSFLDALSLKELEPSRILIISVEDNREQGDAFFNSIPVISTIPQNSIIYRMILNESVTDYNAFCKKYGVFGSPAMYVFGPNTIQISRQWTIQYPKPEDFANYISEINIGAFENVDVDNNSQNILKTIKISVRTEKCVKFQKFYENDHVSVLKNWLETEFGKNHQYTKTTSTDPIPLNGNYTLKELGLYPSAVLVQIQNSQNIFSHVSTRRTSRYGFSKYLHKLCKLTDFINPFAKFDESDEGWEYPPPTNPDIRQVVVDRFTHGI